MKNTQLLTPANIRFLESQGFKVLVKPTNPRYSPQNKKQKNGRNK